MSAAGGISIPLDVVTDILCNLPVKTVLRFKAVSKVWCSLIDSSSYFAHLHLSASNDDPMLVILTNEYIEKTGFVVCADFYSLDDVEDDGASSSLKQVRPRSCPFKPRNGCSIALGSCHGMLVLGSREGNLDFWNPITNQCYSTQAQAQALNQYKLVQRVDQPHGGGICEFQSYNLEANGFTTFHTLPDDHAVDHPYRQPYCFVNGALHYLAAASSDGFPSEIVALHLETLECYKLKLPIVQDEGMWRRMYIDVWVMKEYGGEWTKLFNLITYLDCGIHHSFVYPIGYSKNRDKVLLHFFFPGDFLGWYHLKQKKFIAVNIPGGPHFFGAILCLPSLVNHQSSEKLIMEPATVFFFLMQTITLLIANSNTYMSHAYSKQIATSIITK
ncbi:hypothetical protein Tsubulata_022660 [Turnera subulata]|uniref:F-box domain-containing protein n=1 Tax=Turnera subulata TaxID=218843 RepID=A0A9Q0GFQ2_9ROSI|nr:hypothetical protein Tsubulata_022660 [Turnera subulata]